MNKKDLAYVLITLVVMALWTLSKAFGVIALLCTLTALFLMVGMFGLFMVPIAIKEFKNTGEADNLVIALAFLMFASLFLGSGLTVLFREIL